MIKVICLSPSGQFQDNQTYSIHLKEFPDLETARREVLEIHTALAEACQVKISITERHPDIVFIVDVVSKIKEGVAN